MRFANLMLKSLLLCSVALCPITFASAQSGTRQALRQAPSRLQTHWKNQLASSSISGAPRFTIHVSGERSRTVYEVTEGARSQTYMGFDAERQADLRQRILAVSGRDAKLQKHSYPAVTLYAMTGTGRLESIDGESGTRNWSVRIGGSGNTIFAPAATDEHVAVVSGASMYLVSRAEGKLISREALDFAPGEAPVAMNTRVLVPPARGSFTIFDYKESEDYIPEGRMDSFGKLDSRPQWTPGGVIWSNDDGQVFVADSETGRSRYQVQCRAPVIGQPIYAPPGRFYIAVKDGYLICVDSEEGELLWEHSLGTGLATQPFFAEGRAFVVSLDGRLFCIDAELGVEVWSVPGIRQVVGRSQGYIYCESTSRAIVTIELQNGETLDALTIGRNERPLVNGQTDRVYLISNSGSLRCLRSPAAKWPTIYGESQPAKPAEESSAPAEEVPAETTTDPEPVPSVPEPVEDEDPFGGDPFGDGGDDGMDDGDDPFDGGDDDPFGAGDDDDPFGL